MRNLSSVRSSLRRAIFFPIAGAALLAFCAPVSRAQCSGDNDPDSYDCQLQQTAPPPSTTDSSPSSMALSMQQSSQGSPRPDLSTQTLTDDRSPAGQPEQELSDRPNAAGQQARQPLPAEPPTEFQRFVEATTGHMLPVFGISLFAARPATFGPIDQAPAPQNMAVGAGDELRIRIWGQVNFSANLRVSREGEIYLPKAGAVHVSGLPFSELAGHLREALDRVYRNYELSVDLGEIHSIQVYVTGQARQPGEYTVSALSTLVDAVFLSGGPSGAGSMRHVELKREGKLITDFDLYALLVKGDKTGDIQLEDGDVLFIPAAGAQVALVGSVRQQAIYELRGEESIGQLLEAAGGRTAVASGGRISVERIEDHAQLRAFELKADATGLAAPLADGDIVRIDPIVSDYRETVTLRGSVANPGRFLWHEGMRLSELMPDRDSLLSRDYWWRRTRLGLPAPEFAPSGAQSQPIARDDQFARPRSDQDSALGDNRFAAPGFTASGADQSETLKKTANARSAESPEALSNVETGEQMQSETALLSPQEQTDWNYAVIERLDQATMTTSLVPFNLGKLVLDHDSSQDIELRPGDVVTVFSQRDIHPPASEQTKYVRLEGEFEHAGVYSVLPGETLRSLVARAGGFTPNAYLYAAEFTRKSTQEIEQQRLNDFADRLEHQLLRSSLKMDSMGSAAANAGGDGSLNGGQGGQVYSVNHELIDRLRQLRPTGRIVLDMGPHSAGANELPETPLEDGDTLLVPSIPATVQVIGAVPDQSAFLYRAGARTGEYLHLAGGMTGDADRGQTFILRADGSVVGHVPGQSIFSSGFDNQRLYPGDTIIVPEKNIGAGGLHTFLAWSQILSQFALGAAAITVLK